MIKTSLAYLVCKTATTLTTEVWHSDTLHTYSF